MNATNCDKRRQHPEVDAVMGEISELLMVQWVYYSHLKHDFPNPHKVGTDDIHRWIFTTRIMENDMVMRLCRLDEEDKSKHSFREALKAVRNLIPDSEAQHLDKRIKKYRQLINPLKTKARNYDLAHLAKGAKPHLDPRFDLSPAIAEAVVVFDEIVGEVQNYTFRSRKDSPVIKLRDYISKPTPDPDWAKASIPAA
jgi:hypothetical protein